MRHGAFIAGNDGRTSLRVGMGLSQIGEFSFIIAALGMTLQVTSDFLYPVAVAVSAITTLLTPYLIRAADPLSQKLGNVVPARLARVLSLYGEWLRNIQPQGESAMLAAMIRRILLQVGGEPGAGDRHFLQWRLLCRAYRQLAQRVGQRCQPAEGRHMGGLLCCCHCHS